MALPKSIAVVSYNMWLIPFHGAWNLGRVFRCRDHVVSETRALLREVPDCELAIVAFQEAWAFRVGVVWPLLWLQARLEALALFALDLAGGVEPWLLHWPKLAINCVAVVMAWVPVVRRVLYCPKGVVSGALAREFGFAWQGSGRDAFAAWPLSTWPPLLMDSGLLLCASRAPDASGFEGYDRAGSAEAVANKGMVWATFGKLGVVNTHMTFEFADGGGQRAKQQRQLASLVGALLGVAPTRDGLPTCDAVLLVGDFNHALDSQTTDGPPGDEPQDGSRSTYRWAWLPANASLDHLLKALALDGQASVTRMSNDAPTNLDGTVDHFFVVTKATAAAAPVYRPASKHTVADDAGHISDHLMIKAMLTKTA